MKGLGFSIGLGVLTSLIISASNDSDAAWGIVVFFPLEVIIGTTVGAILGEDRIIVINNE